MGGRLIGLLGLVVAFVLAAQLRGSAITAPTPRSLLALFAFIAGVVILAGVLGNNLRGKKHKREGLFSPDPKNRRQTFRIVYPGDERPRLLLTRPGDEAEELEVLDLSEEGLRCRRTLRTPLPAELAGDLLFPDGRRAQVAGPIVRQSEDQLCLHLHRTIPPNLVVEEQLRLHRLQNQSDAPGKSE